MYKLNIDQSYFSSIYISMRDLSGKLSGVLVHAKTALQKHTPVRVEFITEVGRRTVAAFYGLMTAYIR